MSAELNETTPSEGLRRQTRPEEEIKWTVRKDMKTAILGTIASSISLIIFTGVFGVFAGVFAAEAVGSALVGFLVFLLVAIGIPVGRVLLTVLYIKYGNFEYAATEDRFMMYEETLTSTTTDAVPIHRVRDAEYSEDMWDKILGTGDIRIEGARGDSLYFNNVPEGDAVLRAVREEIAEADTIDEMNPQTPVGRE